jgi:solute carrier family 25 oxoglutarate transporter 11
MRTINGVPEYAGLADVLFKTVRNEGVLSLWKGFVPFFLRLGPHTIVAFMTLEQLTLLYKRFAA